MKPLLLDEEMKKLIYESIEKGCTEKEIYTAMGVSKTTFTKWKNENPDFAATIKKIKWKPIKQVEAALYKRAIGYEVDESHEEFAINEKGEEKLKQRKFIKKHIAGDVTAMIFYLKNRNRKDWSDKVQMEHTGNVRIEIDSSFLGNKSKDAIK